jgi:hypothetical protein
MKSTGTDLPRSIGKFLDGVDDVQDGGVNVIVFSATNSALDAVTKFVISDGTDVTYAEEYLDTYLDWGTENFESYFITGYRLRGQAIRKFQSNYVRVYTDNTVPSIFSVRGIWDFALDGTRGRFTEVAGINQLITISDDTSYSVKTKRIKVRGHGLCMQLMFSSQEGEPFDIIGWSIWDTGNAGT